MTTFLPSSEYFYDWYELLDLSACITNITKVIQNIDDSHSFIPTKGDQGRIRTPLPFFKNDLKIRFLPFWLIRGYLAVGIVGRLDLWLFRFDFIIFWEFFWRESLLLVCYCWCILIFLRGCSWLWDAVDISIRCMILWDHFLGLGKGWDLWFYVCSWISPLLINDNCKSIFHQNLMRNERNNIQMFLSKRN